MKPELSPGLGVRNAGRPLWLGVGEQRHAPLGEVADLGQRHRDPVGRERHRLGVEVAAGEDLALLREHQRVVGDAVGLALERRPRPRPAGRRRPPSPAAGSAASRGPGPARSRGARRGSRCRPGARPASPPTSAWPGWLRARWMRGSNGTSLPSAASVLMAPATSAASNRRRALNRPVIASAVETWVPLSSAKPSLAASVSGASPIAASASPPAAPGRRSRTRPTPISARGDVGQRGQVARGADRALARDHRQGVVGEQAQERRRSVARRTPERPRPRLAAFSTSTSRTVVSSSGAPTPHMCESTRRRCSSAMSAAGDAYPGQLAEAGVDAVDRRLAGGGLGDQRRRGVDAGPRRPGRARAAAAAPRASRRGAASSSRREPESAARPSPIPPLLRDARSELGSDRRRPRRPCTTRASRPVVRPTSGRRALRQTPTSRSMLTGIGAANSSRRQPGGTLQRQQRSAAARVANRLTTAPPSTPQTQKACAERQPAAPELPDRGHARPAAPGGAAALSA